MRVLSSGIEIHSTPVEADPAGLPELRVLLEYHAVAAQPFLHDEGAGRDGLLA